MTNEKAKPSFHEGDPSNGATTLPVWNSTGFSYGSAEQMEKVFEGKAPGYVYSRISNPTLMQFEKRMAELEGGRVALSFSTGMAAISSVMLALASSGDQIVSSATIFGGTYTLFVRLFARLGIEVVFVDPADTEAVAAAITEKTRAVFVETMGNPALDVPDIEALSKTAKERGVALVVDNTVTTPALFRPLAAGADIVVESASKYINGTGTALGGVIVDACGFDWGNGRYPHLAESARRFGPMAFSAFLRQEVFRDTGPCFNPQSAFLMSVGLDTLAVRMERHCGNALFLAKELDALGSAKVRYPGLDSHADHEVARRQFGGKYGAILTLRLGSRDGAFRFINALKKAMIVANIGDARTLVIHPASTFCRDLDEAKRLAMGAHEDLVRMSIGLEDPQELLDDIRAALDEV